MSNFEETTPHCGNLITDDYLSEIYDWAFTSMECCDEPEWSLFSGITSVIEKYWRETRAIKLKILLGD